MVNSVTDNGDWLSATKWLIGISIVLTEILFLYFYEFPSIELTFSSALVTLALLVQLRYGIKKKAATPADGVVFIFCWLFLDLAPTIQLISSPRRLVNTSTVVPSTVFITNIICALFILTFTVIYVLSYRKIESQHEAVALRPAMPPVISSFGVTITLVASILIVLVAGKFAYSAPESGSPVLLIINRFLLFIPSASALIIINESNDGRSKWYFSRVCVVILLLLLVAITENPLTEKRNALGPLYISLALIAFRGLLRNPNRRLLFLISAMMLIFPTIEVFTHNHYNIFHGVSFLETIQQIYSHYLSINYDAWANTYTITEMVERHGIQWGRQLFGALLFFVPSALWTTKPLATGIFVGNYLIENYRMWFNNLSAPLVGEAYIDFGFIGVVGYGAALAVGVAFLESLAIRAGNWQAKPLAIYMSIFLMFLLRGSLMVAVAFIMAALLAFYVSAMLLSVGTRKLGIYFNEQRVSPPELSR
jgi:hypothetical protein